VRTRHLLVLLVLACRGASAQSEDPASSEASIQALRHAADWGRLDEVERLLDQGVPAFGPRDNGPGLLHLLATHDAPALVARLVDEGLCDLRAGDPFGYTALHYAAAHDRQAVADALLERGAEIENRDAWGRTPLHLAGDFGHPNLVRMLLERGADPLARDHRGATPLHWAAGSGRDTAVAAYLMPSRARAAAQVRDDHGWTPLHVAAAHGALASASRLAWFESELLDAPDELGRTPLHLAARFGWPVLYDMIRGQGARIDVADTFGKTPQDYLRELQGRLATAPLAQDEKAEEALRERASRPFVLRIERCGAIPHAGVRWQLWEDGGFLFATGPEREAPLAFTLLSAEKKKRLVAELAEAGLFDFGRWHGVGPDSVWTRLIARRGEQEVRYDWDGLFTYDRAIFLEEAIPPSDFRRM